MYHNTFPAEPRGTRGMLFFEDLKAAAPENAQPYCCYACTVIFYKQPYQVVNGQYEEHTRAVSTWDMLGHRWTDQDLGWASMAPLVWHEGQVYELSGAQVIWKDGRWVKEWLSWRLPEDDHRLIELKRLGWDPFPAADKKQNGDMELI